MGYDIRGRNPVGMLFLSFHFPTCQDIIDLPKKPTRTIVSSDVGHFKDPKTRTYLLIFWLISTVPRGSAQEISRGHQVLRGEERSSRQL